MDVSTSGNSGSFSRYSTIGNPADAAAQGYYTDVFTMRRLRVCYPEFTILFGSGYINIAVINRSTTGASGTFSTVGSYAGTAYGGKVFLSESNTHHLYVVRRQFYK